MEKIKTVVNNSTIMSIAATLFPYQGDGMLIYIIVVIIPQCTHYFFVPLEYCNVFVNYTLIRLEKIWFKSSFN
jgi:hypothetical protein